MAEKLSKRDLQGPDKFQQEAGGVLDWAHDHPKEVALGGAGVLVLILVVGLAFGGRDGGDPMNHEAGADLAAALELVDRPVGAGTAATGAESFADEREKQEAIVAALTQVREEHAGTQTANAAALPLADARFKLGQYDQALALYDEYLQKAPSDAHLRFLALEGRAQTLEAQNQLDQAVQAWERFGSEAPAYQDRALFGKARLLEKQGQWDEARTAYERIQKDFPQGAVTRLAGERLAQINRAHPPAAAPAGAAAANEGQ